MYLIQQSCRINRSNYNSFNIHAFSSFNLSRMKTLLCFVCCICILFVNCKKSKPIEERDLIAQASTELPEWAINALDEIPRIEIDTTEIILPDGSTLKGSGNNISSRKARILNTVENNVRTFSGEENKVKLVTSIVQRGLAFISSRPAPAGNDSLLEPEQKYLAYLFGGKEGNIRQSAYEINYDAKDPGKQWCKQKVFGLDCSGLVYKMAQAAGLNIIAGPASKQDDPKLWNDAIKRAESQYSGLKAVRYNKLQIPAENLESGDIIFWKNNNDLVSHTGVVVKLSFQILIIQSNGSGDSNCEKNFDYKKRGPRAISLDSIESAFANRSNPSSGITYASVIRFEAIDDNHTTQPIDPTKPVVAACPGVDVKLWWATLNPTVKRALNYNVGLQGTDLPDQNRLALLFGRAVLDLSNQQIEGDLKFPKCFPYLISLNLDTNSLASLDISLLPNLRELKASSNGLSSIKLDNSGNSGLEALRCFNNKLTNLNLSGLKQLDFLDFQDNLISQLNVNDLPSLEYLVADRNLITTLNILNLGNLVRIQCGSNKLTNLSLSGLTKLETLYIQYNNLQSLSLSGAPELLMLYVNNNVLTSLDLSPLRKLVIFSASYNKLTKLTSSTSSLKSITTFNCDHNKLGYNNLLSIMENLNSQAKVNWGNCNFNDIKMDNGEENSYIGSDCQKLTEFYQQKFK
jgi:hypothetical protein